MHAFFFHCFCHSLVYFIGSFIPSLIDWLTAGCFCQLGETEVPPDIPACLPAPLRDVISACLEMDPDKRPSAKQLLKHSYFTQSLQASADSDLSSLMSVTSVLDPHPSCWSRAVTPLGVPPKAKILWGRVWLIEQFLPLYDSFVGGDIVGRINIVNQRRARLVLGWVTVGRWVNHVGM